LAVPVLRQRIERRLPDRTRRVGGDAAFEHGAGGIEVVARIAAFIAQPKAVSPLAEDSTGSSSG